MASKKAAKPSGEKPAKRPAKKAAKAAKAAAPRVERPTVSEEESLENLKTIVGLVLLDEKFRKRLLSRTDKTLAKYRLHHDHLERLLRAIEDPRVLEALIVMLLKDLGLSTRAI
jgi:hypothetical protein